MSQKLREVILAMAQTLSKRSPLGQFVTVAINECTWTKLRRASCNRVAPSREERGIFAVYHINSFQISSAVPEPNNCRFMVDTSLKKLKVSWPDLQMSDSFDSHQCWKFRSSCDVIRRSIKASIVTSDWLGLCCSPEYVSYEIITQF